MATGTEGGYDAAWPVGAPPPGDQVVMGYLGGDTPHPWSAADWASQPARYRIGIWTRSNPVDAVQGTAEGQAAAAAWKALGATLGSLIVLDYETAINPQYLAAFDAQVVAAGFKVAVYGSKSTLFQNPAPSGGYFPADLTGVPHLYPGTVITQYAFETDWDDDTISSAAVLWDTRPAADPPATSTRRNDMHIDLKPNEAVVFTNPAAVLGGQSTMLLASDFGDAQVRVATYSFKSQGWTVTEHPVGAKGGAVSLPLPADTNKVSVVLQTSGVPVGLDVLA